MLLQGWGRYSQLEVQVSLPLSKTHCVQDLQYGSPLIPRGLGRSYGDSALFQKVLSTRYLDHFEAFDAVTGTLTCDAGVSLDDILRTFVPLGWFLNVTPGTRFITVGGAIASDVHGKNHHGVGTFCTQVERLSILLGNGECVIASPIHNADLFSATCGGMGLTGVILSATFSLRPIVSSDIVQTTIKAPNLESALDAFECHSDSTYSVAWIDCLATGASLGRSLVMLGEHSKEGTLIFQPKAPINVPCNLPISPLNHTSVQAFNTLYYGRIRQAKSTKRISLESFFYPLDSIANWNHLYGKSGFLQYQFVLPKIAGIPALREVLVHIAQSGQASFLAVLKVFGAQNSNMLSFPIEGYTLALDFKVEPSVFLLLEQLDQIVLHYGGRLYLTKDSRMSETTFKFSYSRWHEFEEVRALWHAHGKFASSQSRRLGLL